MSILDENDPNYVDPDARWWQGPCTCTMCGHKQVSVIELDRGQGEPLVPLECGYCGNMTANPD